MYTIPSHTLDNKNPNIQHNRHRRQCTAQSCWHTFIRIGTSKGQADKKIPSSDKLIIGEADRYDVHTVNNKAWGNLPVNKQWHSDANYQEIIHRKEDLLNWLPYCFSGLGKSQG